MYNEKGSRKEGQMPRAQSVKQSPRIKSQIKIKKSARKSINQS